MESNDNLLGYFYLAEMFHSAELLNTEHGPKKYLMKFNLIVVETHDLNSPNLSSSGYTNTD